MEDGYVKFSCLIGVPDCPVGAPTVLAHEGGVVYQENQLKIEVYEGDACADDIFDKDFGTNGPGLFVFSGEMKPVYDDMPLYKNTETRKATAEDVSRFLKIS